MALSWLIWNFQSAEQDKFVDGISGRPRWEDAGVQIVEDVHPYELTKIRLLNVVSVM
jgi:mannitol-1-phosphate/altronate dehydrogenase